MELLTSEIKELFDNFTKKELDVLNRRLNHYFTKKYGREPRLKLRRKDLIQGAIKDAYEGRRQWHPEKADLVGFLCGAIRSNASHILEKENKYPLQPIEEISEMVSLKKEDSYTYLQLSIELRDLVKGDQLLERMVELLIQDPELKPRDMLELLPGVSKRDLYNANKRLKALLKKEKEQGNG